MTNRMLDAALSYVDRGWHVFPLKKGDKVPATRHGFKDATTDADQVRAWWSENPRYNIGIATGEDSGLVVIDTDTDEAEEYVLLQGETLTLRQTTAKGRHRLYQHPGVHTPNRAGLHGVVGLDIRGDGGYIVAAPSVHPTGAVYVWESDDDLAPLPGWVTRKPEQALARAAATHAAPRDPYAERALHGELGKLALCQNGTRNDTLFRVARRVNEFVQAGRLPEQVFDEVESIALRTGLTEREVLRTIISARSGGTPEDAGKPEPLRRNGTLPERTQSNDDNEADDDTSAAIIKLQKLGYSFALNDVSDTIEVNGKPMNDIIAAEMRVKMRRAGFTGMGAIHDEITYEAAQNRYHPIKEYLESCFVAYDGADHIGALASYMECSDPGIIYGDGTHRALHHTYLLRWMVGAVAKGFDQEQNVMLVLAGPQNTGKSSFVRWLSSGIPNHFLEASITPGEKDTEMRLMSNFVWEVSELDATTRKADVAALKAFVTKETVTVRRPYGRHDTVKPALASLIGTINPSTGFLTDTTGNRRFMTTTIERIDWNYVRDIDVNQLWGQAVALYRAGEPWRLSAEECDVRDDTNEEHKVGSLLDGWIETWFDLTDDPRDAMKASGIASHLMSKDIRLHGSETAQAMAIAKALQRLGANKGEGRMRYWYVGIRPRHEPNNTPPPEGVSTSQALTEVPTKALTKNTPLQSHGEHMRTCKHLLEQTLEKQSYQGGEEKTERVDGFSAEVPTGTHTTGEIKHQEEENTPVSTLVGTSSRSTDQVRTEVSVVPGTTNVNAQAESEPLAPPRLVIVPEGDGWYVCEHEGDELYHTNNVCYPTEAAARMVAQQIYTQAQHE